MFTLTYHLLSEKIPDHKSKVCYYVLKGDYQLTSSLAQQFCDITYEWFSDNGEISEYYKPEYEGQYKLFDTRPSIGWPDEDVRLCLCIDHQPVWQLHTGEVKIAWNYTHDIMYAVSKYQEGKNYFPCFDVNNLLREGLIKVISWEKCEVGVVGNAWFHIYADVVYKDEKYHLRLAQEDKWDEDAWTVPNKFGKVGVFEWYKIEDED
jgi:hypothetical protein